MNTHNKLVFAGETYNIGDRFELEFKSGKKYKVPIQEIVGHMIWFDDGNTRIQWNIMSGVFLILSDNSKKEDICQLK